MANPVLMWPLAPAGQLHLDVGNAQLLSSLQKAKWEQVDLQDIQHQKLRQASKESPGLLDNIGITPGTPASFCN